MRASFSAGVRRHDREGTFLAQVLEEPRVSSAAPSAEEALSKLAEALVEVLERAHPVRLASWLEPSSWRAERVEVPVYKVFDPFGEGDGVSWVDATIDCARATLAGGVEVLFAPAFGVLARGEDEEQALRALTSQLRRLDGRAGLHRPSPDDFEIVSIEVEFEPLDLIALPVEHIWMPIFGRELLEDHHPRARPATPTLEKVAERWSGLSEADIRERGFEPVFARQRAIDELEELIEAVAPTPVVLVGAARVGKTALVRHMAWRRRKGEGSARRAMWFASSPRLCATDAFSSGWQQQCRELFAELETADEILYIGRVVEALDAGKFVGSDYNLAQFVKPIFADRRVRVIAEATPEEWTTVEQRDVGFARTFHVVRLDDPPEDVAVEHIVAPAAARVAAREELEITADAVQRAWNLQQRFAAEGSAVGRTVDFLARVARRARSAYAAEVGDMDLVESFCESTGLPRFMLLDERTLEREHVIATLEQRVMGQRQAVERVADVIGITKAGLAPPDRPLGSFLFVGPTGVGKTELARAVADFLFGDEERLVRLDMSEYSHPDAYGRLIGEGHVVQTLEADYAPGGDLTGPVRRQPFCVVLLDEIEKAHASVFDLLLQVLGEARLTDASGRTTRFQNTIVIMTSNLGVDSLRPSIGFSGAGGDGGWASHFRREAERFFRPEFLARIEQFIPFRPLSREIVTRIARRELDRLHEREGVSRLDVEFDCGEAVAGWVAERGWDPQYGARPLKRVIEREIAWPLARRLADSQAGLEPDQLRRVRLGVRGDALDWSLEILEAGDSDHASRQSLLELIEHIAGLRRRLQNYIFTDVFSDLEWEIENFDISSQAAQFWRNPGAADMATRAEQARRIVTPAEAMAQELGALEDLAHEAYHSRSFDIRDDLRERVAELEPDVRRLFMVILRSAFSTPDEATIFIGARRGNDPWRAQLVRWYARFAERYGLELELMRARTDSELERLSHEELSTLADNPKLNYTRVGMGPDGQLPSTEVMVLRFEGFAAYPLLLGEDGLHRLVAPDGNAVADVIVLEENARWPTPHDVLVGRPNPHTARVWNRRTGEISVPFYASVPFDEDDPWEALADTLEEIAWMIVESRWD